MTMFVRVPLSMALASVAVLCAQTGNTASSASDEKARGQALFRVHCSGCHGFEGRGGLGPSLARPKLRFATSVEGVASVIFNGIPDTPMPRGRMLSERERWLVANYVVSLGQTPVVPLPGDGARGETLVKTKGACLTCHTISGAGGTTGPDLTEIGLRRGPEFLHRAIVEPGAQKSLTETGYTEFLPVRVSKHDGTELMGMRLNEDSFTIQLRDLENRLHSLSKAELRQVSPGPVPSVMPSYATVFSPAEQDDIVAYLASLRGRK